LLDRESGDLSRRIRGRGNQGSLSEQPTKYHKGFKIYEEPLLDENGVFDLTKSFFVRMYNQLRYTRAGRRLIELDIIAILKRIIFFQKIINYSNQKLKEKNDYSPRGSLSNTSDLADSSKTILVDEKVDYSIQEDEAEKIRYYH
jgi:hypothetical protein